MPVASVVDKANRGSIAGEIMSKAKPSETKPRKKTKAKPKAKTGRPSSFPKGRQSAIKKLVLMGATDKDLAEAFDVTEQTVNNWKIKYPEFFESLKDWKLQADANVEKALYLRAVGYSHKDTKFATYEGVITDEREYDKHYPPDTAAAFIWLQNRKPSEWKREQTQHDGNESLADALMTLAKKLPG